MAKNTDSWRKLMNQFSKTRKLSYEWLNKKPSPEEFDLEDYNINALYRRKKKFENERLERINALRKEILPPRRGTFSWEGYVAILFMMGMVAYQVFVTEPTFIMFGFLAIGAMFFFFLYYFRLRKKQITEKKKLEEITARQRKIETEPFEYDEAYDSLVLYARAMYDYEAWARRKKQSWWKEIPESVFQTEIVSMLNTYGYDAYTAERRDISIFYGDDESDRNAVYCKISSPVTEEETDNFLRAIKRNEARSGMMISASGFEDEAKSLCEDRGIEAWDLKDLLDFEKEIEKARE